GSGHLQFGQVELRGARGDRRELRPLPVPDAYLRPDGTDRLAAVDGPAGVVAHAYHQLRAALRDGTSVVPAGAHAAEHPRLLDRITRAAETGSAQQPARPSDDHCPYPAHRAHPADPGRAQPAQVAPGPCPPAPPTVSATPR